MKPSTKTPIATTLIALLALIVPPISQASTVTFNGGFISEAGGTVSLASGDLWKASKLFDVQPGQNVSAWNVQDSTLQFFKSPSNYTNSTVFTYSAIDRGPVNSPWLPVTDPNHVQNMAWGELIISAGHKLTNTSGVVYARRLSFPGASSTSYIAAQVATFTGSLKIYYSVSASPALGGFTYNFGSGGGQVIPVP